MLHLVTYKPNQPKIRLGRRGDGGYVIASGLAYDAYISCGISNEVSFDQDFVVHCPGIPAYAFDGTVNRPPQLPASIEFHRMNIAPYCSSGTTDLKELILRYNDVFLKMDIEGHEWKWILSIENEHLCRIKQIVLEVHGLFDNQWNAMAHEKQDALCKLASTHNIVHVHANNNGHDGPQTPYVLELTYVRKDVGVAGLNDAPFPVDGIDFPNNDMYPDICINKWPFVSSQSP